MPAKAKILVRFSAMSAKGLGTSLVFVKREIHASTANELVISSLMALAGFLASLLNFQLKGLIQAPHHCRPTLIPALYLLLYLCP